jgi:hypothetical protein
MERIIAFIISLLYATFGIVGCHTTSNDDNHGEVYVSEYSEIDIQSEEKEPELFQSENKLEEDEICSEDSEEVSKYVDNGIFLPDIDF